MSYLPTQVNKYQKIEPVTAIQYRKGKNDDFVFRFITENSGRWSQNDNDGTYFIHLFCEEKGRFLSREESGHDYLRDKDFIISQLRCCNDGSLKSEVYSCSQDSFRKQYKLLQNGIDTPIANDQSSVRAFKYIKTEPVHAIQYFERDDLQRNVIRFVEAYQANVNKEENGLRIYYRNGGNKILTSGEYVVAQGKNDVYVCSEKDFKRTYKLKDDVSIAS